MTLVNLATCSACEANIPCNTQRHYPDGGWVLPFDTFGYDGGFDDNIAVLFDLQRTREWILCHGCVVKFFELFPRLGEIVGANCHPCDDDVPCCRHAWQATEIFGKNVFGVHTRTAWPDGVWHDEEPSNPYDSVLPSE